MADFNQVFDAGDHENGTINVVVEIPAGSSHKIEWDRKIGVMRLDRVEPKLFAKPTNYGFIPQTLDEDGDELDAHELADFLDYAFSSIDYSIIRIPKKIG